MSTVEECNRCRRRTQAPLFDGLCPECRRTASWAALHNGPHLAETATAGAASPPADTTPKASAAPATSTDPLPRSRFEVLEPLGRGGMGAVWKVRERATGAVFAMKTLRDPAGPHAARFRIEAQALTRLRHPNIVRVHEIDLEGDALYFTMEFVEGQTLENRARRDGPLPPAEAAGLVETIARAADHAHRAGVIHRDIKPANVLITESGEVKVSDFGLAKRLDRADGRTTALSALGTPGYMAPEQVSRDYGRMG